MACSHAGRTCRVSLLVRPSGLRPCPGLFFRFGGGVEGVATPVGELLAARGALYSRWLLLGQLTLEGVMIKDQPFFLSPLLQDR